MSRQLANSAARFAGTFAKLWRAAKTWPADKYRPEAYYMRGPGPKWHAKRARSTQRG